MAAAAACGGGTPSGPTGTAPRVVSINPTSGPSSGGTAVTISGSNFVSGAIVTIGGTPATSVALVNEFTLTAVTGARAAGAADVVVTVGGRSGTLPGGFTYVLGQAPVIQAIVARGSRANEPERFADLGEEITVTATVQDGDTPPGGLTYGWAAPSGTFTGTGASVKWRAPQTMTTPGTVSLSLSVSDGGSTATGGIVVRVHDSAKEVGDMARLFLEDFSRQTLAPEEIVRNFREGCGVGGEGKENELWDVRNNQRTDKISQWSVGSPRVTVEFGGVCPFRAREGDACAQVRVDWITTCINETRYDGSRVCTFGVTSHIVADDQLTATYADNRWWLCDSDIGPNMTLKGPIRPSWTFMR